MTGNNKFFSENEKNELMNLLINTNYDNEDETWDLSMKLEQMSIIIRRNILEQNKD